jgi:hypothetical protein
MLNNGKKIWRTQSTDGVSVLYVIHGPKVYGENWTDITITATEAAMELGKIEKFRNSAFDDWIVNETFINKYFGKLFDPGVLDGPTESTAYNGELTALAVINEIQEKTGGEFQYRYEYDGTNNVIKRYIDFHEQIGETHTEVIEMGRNAKIIHLSIDDTEVGVAAGPIGEPSSASDEFHKNRAAFEALSVPKGASIPLYYTKDDDGNEVPGPNAYAPYAKIAGKNYVECDEESEKVGNYLYINGKEKSSTEYPIIIPFESSESNPIHLYWACVNKTRESLIPEVELSIEMVNLVKLQGAEEYYNVGDKLNVHILSRNDIIPCRITKTTKDPRQPASETYEISTYRVTFMQDFFRKNFRGSSGAIKLN